jgi:hypothetical protein
VTRGRRMPALPSDLVSAVASRSLPVRALTRLLLPTPEGPMSASVTPGRTRVRNSGKPSPVVEESARTSAPTDTGAAAAPTASGSSTRSAFVMTTMGVAPDSHTAVSSRSRRR